MVYNWIYYRRVNTVIGLFFIGMFLTVIGLGIGYYIGGKKLEKKEEKKDSTEWIKGYKEWRKRNEL